MVFWSATDKEIFLAIVALDDIAAPIGILGIFYSIVRIGRGDVLRTPNIRFNAFMNRHRQEPIDECSAKDQAIRNFVLRLPGFPVERP